MLHFCYFLNDAKRNFKAACGQICLSLFCGFSNFNFKVKGSPHSIILVRAQMCYLPLFYSSVFPNLIWEYEVK